MLGPKAERWEASRRIQVGVPLSKLVPPAELGTPWRSRTWEGHSGQRRDTRGPALATPGRNRGPRLHENQPGGAGGRRRSRREGGAVGAGSRELREGWPLGPPSQTASRERAGAGGLGVTPCDPIPVTKEGARPPASGGGAHVHRAPTQSSVTPRASGPGQELTAADPE